MIDPLVQLMTQTIGLGTTWAILQSLNELAGFLYEMLELELGEE